MPLTDTAIRALKPGSAKQRLYDGRGLLLQVEPNGGRYWRYKYRFVGKEKLLALGVYPEISLRTARERLEEARRQLSQGVDLGAHSGDPSTSQVWDCTTAGASSVEYQPLVHYHIDILTYTAGDGTTAVKFNYTRRGN